MKFRWMALLYFALIGCIVLATGKRQAAAQGDNTRVRQVFYDHQRPDKRPILAVQVLVDTSASMKGFKKNLPALLHAVDEGLSYSHGLYFDIRSKRACFFDQKRAIFGCQTRVDGVPIPDSSGYTNLDKAVKSAGDYGLTVIFTDGVPSGLSTGKECVGSGVDAACVSEALSSVLRGAPGTDASRLRGAWIVPIITPYEGTYFAEQPIDPDDFRANGANVAEAKIREDLGVNARIDNPRKGNDGTLLFDYQGPRILLALVIGEVAPSRAFLQEFVNHTSFSLLTTLNDAKSYKGGTAILPPVEIFPGTVPPEQYQSCQQSKDQRGRIEGDLVNCAIKGANDFRLSCLAKPSSARLQLAAKEPNRPLHLDLLAPAILSFSGSGAVRKVMMGSGGSSPSKLTLQIACNGAHPVRCDTPESRSELLSTGDVQAAVAELSSSAFVGGYVQKMATAQPAVEPHKIYGLADLLENFYRRSLPESKSVFATLQFCQE